MDPRLVRSAQLGDTGSLNELLEGDPLILNRVALSHIAETPLHIATLAGKATYVRELLNLKPSFAEELNKDGFTPLHIAAATGNSEIVRELLSLKLGPNLCFLKDKFGMNPIHHAAIRGRIGVIQELASFCPDAAKQVTAQGETVLHLAVKNHQFEAVRVLVKLFGEDDENMSLKDEDGRTVLEIAIATKQLQVLDLLGFKGKTKKDSTTLEVLLSETHFETPKATTQQNPNDADTTQTSQQTAEKNSKLWESLDQMVLVVASLIATVTYQAGLSPPQTIWKEDMKNHPKCIFDRTNTSSSSHSCPDITYYLFMSFNTSGFFAAAFLIFFYRKGSYVRVLLPVALISMMITYITLSVSMSPNALSLLILYLITLAIFFYCILAIEMVKKVIQKMFSYAHDRASKLAKLAYERYNKSAGSSGEQP